MIRFLLFLLGIIYHSCQSQETLVVSGHLYYFNQTTSWTLARDTCLQHGGSLVNTESQDLIGSVPNNVSLWGGSYYRKSSWVSYKGCYVIFSSVNKTGFAFNAFTCQSQCPDHQLFAIKNNACYCFQNSVTMAVTKERLCNTTCTNTEGRPHKCGGETAYSVYELVKSNLVPDNGCEQCIGFTCSTSGDVQYNQTSCQDQNTPICQNGTSYTIGSNGLSFKEASQFCSNYSLTPLQWNETQNPCHSLNKYLLQSFFKKPFWTGIIRDILLTNEATSKPQCCQSYTVDQSFYAYRDSCEAQKNFVCQTDHLLSYTTQMPILLTTKGITWKTKLYTGDIASTRPPSTMAETFLTKASGVFTTKHIEETTKHIMSTRNVSTNIRTINTELTHANVNTPTTPRTSKILTVPTIVAKSTKNQTITTPLTTKAETTKTTILTTKTSMVMKSETELSKQIITTVQETASETPMPTLLTTEATTIMVLKSETESSTTPSNPLLITAAETSSKNTIPVTVQSTTVTRKYMFLHVTNSTQTSKGSVKFPNTTHESSITLATPTQKTSLEGSENTPTQHIAVFIVPIAAGVCGIVLVAVGIICVRKRKNVHGRHVKAPNIEQNSDSFSPVGRENLLYARVSREHRSSEVIDTAMNNSGDTCTKSSNGTLSETTHIKYNGNAYFNHIYDNPSNGDMNSYQPIWEDTDRAPPIWENAKPITKYPTLSKGHSYA